MNQSLLVLIGFSCLAFWSPSLLHASDVSQEKTAATFFQNQQYEEALTLWKSMVYQHHSAGIYFNIGLAESKLHQSAKAIYAYEQALRIRPLNETYASALAIERKKIDNAVIPLRPFFLERWYLGWITCFRPGVWAFLGLISLLLGVVIYLISIGAFRVNKSLPKVSFRWIGAVGLFFLITAFLSIQHLSKRDEGIIMHACELKQASAMESPVLRNLSGGEKVNIKDQIGDWYYVALLNLDYGWIKSDCFQRITISNSK